MSNINIVEKNRNGIFFIFRNYPIYNQKLQRRIGRVVRWAIFDMQIGNGNFGAINRNFTFVNTPNSVSNRNYLF